jgi:RNA polymerase sigma-70 factor (ECF subfamily)
VACNVEGMDTDGTLVDNALAGRRNGATRLVARYRPNVFSRLRQLVGDREVAWDLAQDVFLQAFRGLGRLQQRDQFGGWLMTIVWRTYSTWRRSASTKVNNHLTATDPRALDGVPASDADTIPLDIERRDLWRQVGELPAPYRRTLEQRYLEDLPLAEIAQRQGIGLPLAKFRLRRAQALLKELLAGATS